jgi:acyl-CoA synthetase (AMP-forming)/AMP-acid ligase II
MESLRDVALRCFFIYQDKKAVQFQDVSFTFGELEHRVKQLCDGFAKRGLKKGDRIAFLMSNRHEFIELDMACAISGIIKVPLNYRLLPKDHQYMLEQSGTSFLIGEEELIAPLQTDIPHVIVGDQYEEWLDKHDASEFLSLSVSEDDPFAILYTSGTTGKPKGAVLSHRNILSSAMGLIMACEMDRNDVMGHLAPLTHGTSLFIYACFILGIPQSIFYKFEPNDLLQAIESKEVSIVFLVPTMLNLILHEQGIKDKDLSHLKTIHMAGAPIAAEKFQLALEILGPKIVQTYGQVEAPNVLTALGRHEAIDHLTSCGKESLFSRVKVVDQYGMPLAPKEIGEVICQGSLVMKGYWNNEQITQKTIKDGWLYTGDLGFFDQEGYLHLVDRKSDVIISGGSNIYPREVEEVLYQHPAVKEVCSFGIPDEVWGEKVAAHVVLKEGAEVSEEELINMCKQDLAGFKKPRLLRIVESLPKSPYGKILRREIKQTYIKGGSDPHV